MCVASGWAKPALIDPDLFRSKGFRLGITGHMLAQIALGGCMIVLPIYLQMVFEYNALQAGLSLAPLSLSTFAVALLAGRKAGARRPSAIIRVGFGILVVGVLVLLPIVPRAHDGWALVAPLLIIGSGLGLLVSQLNNYTLAPIEEERVSEAAGVNSAGGSFGLSFGLAFAGAIMLAALSIIFTDMANDSHVLAPAQQQRVSDALEDDAEMMSNSHLEEVLAGQPADVKAEVIHINTDARPKALADRPARATAGGADRAFQRLPDGAIAGQRGHRNRRRRPRLLERHEAGWDLPAGLGAVFGDPGLRGLQLGDRERLALPGSRNDSALIAGRIHVSSLTTATRSNEVAKRARKPVSAVIASPSTSRASGPSR